jgi:hypothetical protein
MSTRSIHGESWRSRGATLFAGRLLVRPAALPGESFPGYRLRVAFANGLSNPGWLDHPDSGLPRAHGIARWCPHCLAGAGAYWRETWSSGAAACLEHRCWLTSTCVACHRMLHWKQVRFTLCKCGAPLLRADAAPFSDEVLKLVDEQAIPSSASLSASERWSVARYLGALSQYGLQGKPLKKASRRTEDVEQFLVTAGASLIADSEACFEMFDRLRVPQLGMNNVPLFSEVFPQLLAMLRKQLNEAERSWMLDLLGAYVTNSSRAGVPVLWERKGLAGQARGERYSLPKMRNPGIVRILAQTGESAPVRRTRAGRRKFAIGDEHLLRLQTDRHSFATLKAAARYAGMSCRRVQALTKAGLITSRGGRIDTRSVDRLLRDIATACARNSTALENPVSLAEALRFHVSVEASAAFFDSVMAGAVRLLSNGDGRPTLRNTFAERGDVIAVVQKSVVPDRSISIAEAASQLRVKQQVMYHLVNAGLLRTRTCTLGRRAARVVDVDDLREFDEQFMPLATIANAMGISARKAPEWAMRHGIEIVSGPKVDGGRQYWVRRSTVALDRRKTEHGT